MIENALITMPSNHSVSKTIDRAVEAMLSRGIQIFARIDHAAGASAVGLALRPTEVIIFGNPEAGTLLMQSGQTVALDLPLRLLAYQEASGRTKVAFQSPLDLTRSHGIKDQIELAEKMTLQLTQLAQEISA